MSSVPPPVDDLSVAMRVERFSEDGFRFQVADGWQQGRGAFGGLVLGGLVRALRAGEADEERALRSLTAEIAGPVMVGEAVIRIKALRIGQGLSTWTATLSQNDAPLAQATGVFGKRRIADQTWSPPSPTIAPDWKGWSEVDVAPLAPPFAPAFTQFFEFRPTGPLPFSGGKEPISAGWIRSKRLLTSIGPSEVVALADAWWPAYFATEAGPRPIGTVAFSLQFFTPETRLVPEEPLFHRARAVAAQDGYVLELRELWSQEGQLVALNQQTFVTIK